MAAAEQGFAKRLMRRLALVAVIAAMVVGIGAGGASAASWGSFEPDASWGE
jgi:hypothetical protein